MRLRGGAGSKKWLINTVLSEEISWKTNRGWERNGLLKLPEKDCDVPPLFSVQSSIGIIPNCIFTLSVCLSVHTRRVRSDNRNSETHFVLMD